MIREAHRAGGRQHRLQQRLALDERDVAQVVAERLRQIEGVVRDGQFPCEARQEPRVAHLGALLQERETRPAMGGLHHRLAVHGELRIRQAARQPLNVWEIRRQIQAVAGAQRHRVAIAFDEHPVAVVFHLEQPAGVVERFPGAGEHRLHGEGRALRRARCQALDARRQALRHPSRILHVVQREAGQHRIVRGRLAALAPVALLDEQPLLAVRRGVLALEPNQRPTPHQLVAAQLEQQLAALEALVERLQLGVLAAIPHDDVAGAVVAVWNAALELGIGEGMVFHLHGEALVVRIGRGPLGHRPGAQHAIHLQAHVPMQVAGAMLLHHEDASPAPAGAGRCGERLRRGAGGAFAAVSGEFAGCCGHALVGLYSA